MQDTFANLTFNPSINDIVSNDTNGYVNVLTGANNSGKSAYLKQIIDQPDKLYIGVNRFYSFHHLEFYNDDINEIQQLYQNLQNTKRQASQNFEGVFFNASKAITRLNDDRRKILFDIFTDLFGQKISVKSENPNNQFSRKYVAIDEDSLSVTSSGTRLFLGVLAALMDERFKLVAIDEPELGLSPQLQRLLSDIIIGGHYHEKVFPHKPNIVLGTHSHIFLDKSNYKNNWIVNKENKTISARRCQNFAELHDIQLRLLGNDLGDLFLPHAVIFVEGETDKIYLESLARIFFPKLKIVVQDCSGDIAGRLNLWSLSLGDIQISPYKSRTFAISDKIEQAGLSRICTRIGLPERNIIKWSENGIEYLYPLKTMREIFRDGNFRFDLLRISGDFVTYNGISYKKMDLCKNVCGHLHKDVCLSDELTEKFIIPLSSL